MKGLNGPGRVRGLAVAAVAVFGLTSCGGALNTSLLQDSFWGGGGRADNTTAELGLAELAKGNYIEAESRFQAALKKNPQDIHALLGLGMIYQNNGLNTRARQMYEALLAIRPDAGNQFVIWKNLQTRPISEIASVNLALIESGGVLSSMGRQGAPQASAMANVAVAPPPISGAPTPMAMTARPMPAAPAAGQYFDDGSALLRFAEADTNIVSRFKTLIALREQGLLTGDEFAARRRANIGALLPLTSPPPAAGLDRPVPSTEQISGRLRAIGRGLEMRAISVAQHAAERSMILDALMPAAPVAVANPGRPPQGLLQAADSVRWLEHLRETNLITSDEYTRERTAIENILSPAPAAPSPAAGGGARLSSSAAENEGSARLGGPQPAVHLASYRSLKDAERGWSQLRRAYKADLGGLQPEISRINLGDKGTFYRLKAGPLADKGAADRLCRKMKDRRQFCEATFMNAG